MPNNRNSHKGVMPNKRNSHKGVMPYKRNGHSYKYDGNAINIFAKKALRFKDVCIKINVNKHSALKSLSVIINMCRSDTELYNSASDCHVNQEDQLGPVLATRSS